MDTQEERIEAKIKELIRSWGLSKFSEGMATHWLMRSISEENMELERLQKWILMQLNHQRIPPNVSSWQIGCPEMIPQLESRALWDTNQFEWIDILEKAFPIIKEELLSLKDKKGFQPYRAPSWASDTNAKDGLGSVGHDAGDWNVFYLFLHNVDFRANRALCPKTVEIIESITDHYDHAFFSALAPSTHVKKHHGPTNKKLRCHLPLVVPNGNCALRAGDKIINIQEGKCFIFDDSFEHEAWNNDDKHSRIVLIIDIWHPDLSIQEKKFFSFLRNAQLRMDKKHCQGTKDNFFSIIQEANKNADLSHNEAIWS